ncbi:MAG: DUF6969 family protein [Acidiferrobacterales bacterium]
MQERPAWLTKRVSIASGLRKNRSAGTQHLSRHINRYLEGRCRCPAALFTVNRRVTGDAWYPAHDAERMPEHFVIDHAFSVMAGELLDRCDVPAVPPADDLAVARTRCGD